jgi:hypothetical protein
MESGIFAAGLTSLALGGAMTLFGWKVIRQDRRREAARTALLSQLAFPVGMPRDAITDPPTDAVDFCGQWNQPVGLLGVDEFPRESPVATETLFTKPEPLGAVSRRTVSLAVIGVALAFAIGAFCGWLSLDTRPAAITSAAPASAAVVSATTESVPSPVQTPPPVELLTLTHRATPAAFLVTGQVRNPAGGAPLNDVVAVVEVMDGAGRVLMTVRAPLTRRELNAGEDSAFSATASTANVARYRVEFQNTARVVIPHVDRRQHAVNSQAG